MEDLASEPALAPLLSLAAALSAEERAERLQGALRQIATHADKAYVSDASLWSTLLATLYLSESDVTRINREAGMSVQLRDLPGGRWLVEEGRLEGRREMAGDLAAVRFGADPSWELIGALDLSQLEALTELLAEPKTTADELRSWLVDRAEPSAH